MTEPAAITTEHAALEKQQAIGAASQAIAYIQTMSTRPLAQSDTDGLPMTPGEFGAYEAACAWLARYWAEWV